jgi:hypothetical protein
MPYPNMWNALGDGLSDFKKMFLEEADRRYKRKRDDEELARLQAERDAKKAQEEIDRDNTELFYRDLEKTPDLNPIDAAAIKNRALGPNPYNAIAGTRYKDDRLENERQRVGIQQQNANTAEKKVENQAEQFGQTLEFKKGQLEELKRKNLISEAELARHHKVMEAIGRKRTEIQEALADGKLTNNGAFNYEAKVATIENSVKYHTDEIIKIGANQYFTDEDKKKRLVVHTSALTAAEKELDKIKWNNAGNTPPPNSPPATKTPPAGANPLGLTPPKK